MSQWVRTDKTQSGPMSPLCAQERRKSGHSKTVGQGRFLTSANLSTGGSQYASSCRAQVAINCRQRQSIRSSVRSLNHWVPFFYFRLVMRGKRLRALPIAWHNLLTDVSGTPLQIRVGQSGHHSSVEPGNHVGRRALRRPDAAPGRHIKPLSLSDDQMTAILCATEPLPPGSRVAIPQKRRRRIGQAPGDRRRRSASSPD